MLEPEQAPSATPELRQRLAAEIAAGRTVSLSADEMADPALRQRLPGLLAELTGATTAGVTAGLRLPGYTVLGMIGQGGMSTVHLARHDALGRHVALKVAAWSGTDHKKRTRLLQEARAMARVSHPNIVAIHDIVDSGDTVAIAMEWIDGLTLEALLRALPRQPGPDDTGVVRDQLGAPAEAAARFDVSPVRFFVRVLRDVARALHRVHQAGLLHLDVKPSNVLVRRDGTPLLADFGVVREIDLTPADTRSFAGTPIYSAPEQLRRHDRELGPHTDVYGLGITLYETLARRQPLKDHDLTQLVQAVEKGRVPPLGTQISIAKDLETIVQKAMAPEPRYRYASAADFADDLEAFLEDRPVTARPLSRLRRAQRWARLEPWKAALLAVVLVTLPVVVFLGIELLLGMHHIEAGRLRERRQQANALMQTAYQQNLFGEMDAREASVLLEQAMVLDPGDTSLACLASMVLEEDPDSAARLLARHRDAVARSLGLQLLARKAGERRPFLDATEVGRLAASDLPIDKYVLALDRVFWANDANDDEANGAALFHLDCAALGQEPDPLLMGLRAWFASQAGRYDLRDATCRTMQARWPDSIAVLIWYCITHELHDPDAATAAARAWLERDAGSAPAWELLIGCTARRGKKQEALRLVEQARALHVSSPWLEASFLALLTTNGRGDEAKAALAAMPDRDWPFGLQMVIKEHEGIAMLRQFCNERLAAPQLPRFQLQWIAKKAQQIGDSDLAGRAFARWHQEHPDRRSLYLDEIQRLYSQRDPLGAARLAREVRTPTNRIDSDGAVLCSIFTTARDWPELAELARRWLQFGIEENRPQAAFYAGLAASRQGDLSTAARYLAMATAMTIGDPPPVWYVLALLERAWVLVAPATPPARRDAATAQLLIDRFAVANGALANPRHGPWIAAVQAEVLFAAGRIAAAITTAKAGLAAADDPRLVPPADCREILQDALQRYGR